MLFRSVGIQAILGRRIPEGCKVCAPREVKRKPKTQFTKNAYLSEYMTFISIKGDRTWKRFDAFMEDVGLRPSSDFKLGKKNPKRKHGPNNSQWVRFRNKGDKKANG